MPGKKKHFLNWKKRGKSHLKAIMRHIRNILRALHLIIFSKSKTYDFDFIQPIRQILMKIQNILLCVNSRINCYKIKYPDSGILFLDFINESGRKIDWLERKFDFFAKNFFNRIFVREKILVLQKNSIFFQNRARIRNNRLK